MVENIVSWQYQRSLPEKNILTFEGMLEEIAQALDVSEDPNIPENRIITLFFDASIKQEELLSALLVAEKVVGIAEEGVPITLQPVYDEDWQEKMYHSFPPITEGRFFIYGFEEDIPEGCIGLHIPAGMAFGTGEHATTALCLRLYERLTADQQFKNALDMGSGSGILAIAAVKAQETKVLAVDLHAPSVEACQENFVNNGVTHATAVLGEGFQAPGVIARAPYDLIFANILKNPLIEMAPEFNKNLEKGGAIILSGFTEDQKEDVLKTYTALGLKEVHSLMRDTWCAVALR